MILIADSGSTKTDWLLISDNGEQQQFYTKGFNPNYTPEDEITSEIKRNNALTESAKKVKQIFFYGSGCSAPPLNAIIEHSLRNFFPDAAMTIQNDLFAAVHAVAGDTPGIVCILGTGSNSCYFDGQNVHGETYSIGYILGDEGSGAYLGRQLLRDYFYEIMPKSLQEDFRKKYLLTREEVIEHVYRRPRPNEFIASFLPFLHENISHPYCADLISVSFHDFLRVFVLRFTESTWQPVHFVGSVAWIFSDILKKECAALSLQTGNILRSPVTGLAAYHSKK